MIIKYYTLIAIFLARILSYNNKVHMFNKEHEFGVTELEAQKK